MWKFLKVVGSVLELLAPEVCVFCGARRDGRGWVAGHGYRAPGLRAWDTSHCCAACCERRSGSERIGRAAEWPLVTALAESADLIEAVGAWKYDGLRGLAWPLATIMASTFAAGCERFGGGVVVPVPLHRLRRRERGFDQVRQLAVLTALRAGLICDATILHRCRATAQQADHRTDDGSRGRNVEGAFVSQPCLDDSAASVILVDDLATTGSTLAAAAAALTAAGWRVIWCAALGQAARLHAGEGLTPKARDRNFRVTVNTTLEAS